MKIEIQVVKDIKLTKTPGRVGTFKEFVSPGNMEINISVPVKELNKEQLLAVLEAMLKHY